MKQLTIFTALFFMCNFNYYQVHGQNPTWVMPGGYFQLGDEEYEPLPQNPAWPDPNNPGPSQFRYNGASAQFTQAGYTGPDGELMCFVVDDKVYDKDGWLVNLLRIVEGGNSGIKGHSEMLVLPMGNSCTRFAIIYPGSSNNGFFHHGPQSEIYMGIYNTTLENNFNSSARGAMEGQGPNGTDPTLQNISSYHRINHGIPGEGVFGARSGYQIAATSLMDNCFRYVLLADGMFMFRYKLDENGLHYDNYKYQYSNSGGAQGTIRSEMELIKLSNGNYRVALPAANNEGNQDPGQSIRILELNSDMEVINGSLQNIDLSHNLVWWNVHGMEFSQNGQYLYFTHEIGTGPWTKPLDVWNIATQSLVNLPAIASLVPFKDSYIERYGNALYLVSNTYIGLIPNSNVPLSSNNWVPQFQAIAPGYGNDLDGAGAGSFRHLLPDQVDDDTYGDFDELSCDCCKEHPGNRAVDYVSNGSAFWTPGANPINNGSGPDVYITNELRIRAGDFVVIEDMVFHFSPGASVVIERGNETTNGANLHIKRTKFTADFYCADKHYLTCPDEDTIIATINVDENVINSLSSGANACAPSMWQGIIVEGHADLPQLSYGGINQGRFTMTHKSTVEYAITAIHANGSQGKGGGEVVLRNSVIKDNLRGLWMTNYSWEEFPGVEVANVSIVQNMDFITTGSFYQFEYSSPASHVTLLNIAGIGLYGCRFKNEASIESNFQSAGAGIYASNSGLRIAWLCDQITPGQCIGPITQSTFSNLVYGIFVANQAINYRKVRVGYCDFENVRAGLILSNTINAEVLDNTVSLRNAVDGTFSEVTGLWLIGSTGYSVENNLFQVEGSGSDSRSFGINITSSGEANNEIYRNTFTGLNYGIFTEGLNANNIPFSHPGVVFKCNTFIAPLIDADIFVNSGNIDNFQGSCSQTDDELYNWPANNCFSHSGSNHFDFYLETGNLVPTQQEIFYHFDTPGSACLEPLAVTANLDLNQCPPEYDPSLQCLVKKSANPEVIHELGLLVRMGETEANGMEIEDFIESTAAALAQDVEIYAASFDGGLTAEIIAMLSDAAADGDIDSLLQTIEGPLSYTLNAALEAAGLMPDVALNAEQLSIEEPALTGSELFSAAELQWMGAKGEVAEFWKDVVDFFQVDTTGALPDAALHALLETYKPQGFDRITAALATKLGLLAPEWLTSLNAISPFDAVATSLAEGVEEELPFLLPASYDGNFFNELGNVVSLNTTYVSQLEAYIPYIQTTQSAPSTFVSKSAEIDENKESEAGIQVYPNPFTGQINLLLDESITDYKDVNVQFFDITSRLVQQSRHGNVDKLIVIDGSDFPAGILFYTVIIDGTKVQSGKLIHMR